MTIVYARFIFFNLFIDFPQKFTELYNIQYTYSIFDTKHTFTSYFTHRIKYKYRLVGEKLDIGIFKLKFKTVFLVQNNILSLCSRVVNSQSLYCSYFWYNRSIQYINMFEERNKNQQNFFLFILNFE